MSAPDELAHIRAVVFDGKPQGFSLPPEVEIPDESIVGEPDIFGDDFDTDDDPELLAELGEAPELTHFAGLPEPVDEEFDPDFEDDEEPPAPVVAPVAQVSAPTRAQSGPLPAVLAELAASTPVLTDAPAPEVVAPVVPVEEAPAPKAPAPKAPASQTPVPEAPTPSAPASASAASGEKASASSSPEEERARQVAAEAARFARRRQVLRAWAPRVCAGVVVVSMVIAAGIMHSSTPTREHSSAAGLRRGGEVLLDPTRSLTSGLGAARLYATTHGGYRSFGYQGLGVAADEHDVILSARGESACLIAGILDGRTHTPAPAPAPACTPTGVAQAQAALDARDAKLAAAATTELSTALEDAASEALAYAKLQGPPSFDGLPQPGDSRVELVTAAGSHLLLRARQDQVCLQLAARLDTVLPALVESC